MIIISSRALRALEKINYRQFDMHSEYYYLVIGAYKKVFPEMLQSTESNMNIINSIQEVSRITQME
jgi:hypothetical protein